MVILVVIAPVDTALVRDALRPTEDVRRRERDAIGEPGRRQLLHQLSDRRDAGHRLQRLVGEGLVEMIVATEWNVNRHHRRDVHADHRDRGRHLRRRTVVFERRERAQQVLRQRANLPLRRGISIEEGALCVRAFRAKERVHAVEIGITQFLEGGERTRGIGENRAQANRRQHRLHAPLERHRLGGRGRAQRDRLLLHGAEARR